MAVFNLRLPLKFALAVASLVLLGVCGDPGYRLKPVGWTAADAAWTKDFNDFKLRTKGIGGLRGEWWVDPGLEVVSNSKPISVESAELRTQSGNFTGEIYNQKPIPTGNGGYSLPVKWTFDQKEPAAKILGPGCEVRLNLKVGEESRELRIEYER